MPKTRVVFCQERDGTVPVLAWLTQLPNKARLKCLVQLERLEEMGHELRRPEADLLRDKIYELRVGLQGINYRILYFFHGNTAAVLAQGVVKERKVPTKAIDDAIAKRIKFEQDPASHSYERNLE